LQQRIVRLVDNYEAGWPGQRSFDERVKLVIKGYGHCEFGIAEPIYASQTLQDSWSHMTWQDGFAGVHSQVLPVCFSIDYKM